MTTGFARRRGALLLSSAAMALGFASAAHAQDASIRPADLLDEKTPHSAQLDLSSIVRSQDLLDEKTPHSARLDASTIRNVRIFEPEPQILIANPETPAQAVDRTNITGVGQMIVDSGGGSVGLCTGSLINPRTVLFAAHCVNSRAATEYGQGSGGVGIGFGFQADNLPATINWLLANVGGRPNPLQYQSNPGQAFYNVNQVVYNPLSLEPAARSFLYGDVALATLDTPAVGIPTWALLFSQLPQPAQITAAGTGYNVQITGYGGIGTGQQGQTSGSDFRRRSAENVIGALTSIEAFEGFLFGRGDQPDLRQNLYWIDFDDPRRGLTGASPFDFNAFRDNARTREGTTAPGDSGGPLILQGLSKPVVAGVLSGGYSRFFTGQPANSYGTVSFYQPLYLYWDYIVANNPYRYVTALAGDGRWADPSRWVTTLDPNYQILGANGQLANGVPNDLGQRKAGTSGQFGEACFQTRTSSECRNFATGQDRLEDKPIGTAGDGMGYATITDEFGMTTSTPATAQVVDKAADPEAQAEGDARAQALPPATIANGLPGATNFVPNNVDPNRRTGAIGRYFDVTLGAAGTTTLDIGVTIDRFALNNAGARLNITSAGSLTSLIDVTQMSGVMQVDGTLTSRGDYLAMGGGIVGSGRINAPFTTAVAAAISPGTQGGIGTLTFGGNLILASASSVVIDLGPNGTSDRIAVVATQTNAGGQPLNGQVNIGGRIAFGATTGYQIRAGDFYTVLTAAGGRFGTFQTPGSISAILTPTLEYTTNAVNVRVTAGLYRNVVDQSSPVQSAYARLLDQNRSNSAALSALFVPLDLADAATIRSTLDSLAPRTETLKTSLAVAAVDNMSRFHRERIAFLKPGDMGGSLAVIGKPVETASLALTAMPGQEQVASDSGSTVVTEGVLPETVSAFIAGGYIDGSGRPMRFARPAAGRDQFDGFYVAAGIETEVGDNAAIGFSMSYTDIDGETGVAGQTASGRLVMGTLYGKLQQNMLYVDAQIGAGLFDARTRRDVGIVGTAYSLRSEDDLLAVTSEVGVGADLGGEAIRFGPRVAFRSSYLDFSRTVETGGGPALGIQRESLSSAQIRAGAQLSGRGRIRPYLSGAYVHDFLDQPEFFGANFVAGVGPQAFFALGGQDKNWFEVSGGLAADLGAVELSIGADTTFKRSDVRNQSYRGAIKFRF